MSLRQTLVGAVRMPGIAWSFSRLGYARRARSFDPAALDVSLKGKQCLVTGANSGIGFAVARGLAARHADVWLLCRDRERAATAARALAECGTGRIAIEIVDIADGRSIQSFVERFSPAAIDVLVHNAGALFHRPQTTADGLDQTFALHVVGPQSLTHGLLDRLRAAESPRVVYVSSGGMYSERLSVTALTQPPTPFDGVQAYARAKRAQVVLAALWAQRHPDIQWYAMHPGWADTKGVETALPGFYRATKRVLRTPDEGADTALWLACAQTLPVPNGAFVFDRAKAPRHRLPGTRTDAAEHQRLWDALQEIIEAPRDS